MLGFAWALLITSSPALLAARENPILPGFHPDPSCIYVDSQETFFCASSSFNVFPGIPIHASKDLVSWRLIGNVISRPTQLLELSQAVGGTSGIWAPALRFHEGTFYLFTTLVFDKKPKDDETRFDNIFFTTSDPLSFWSDPTHFKFVGYDVSPFWHEDGQVYVHGAHTWEIGPHVDQMILDLKTGEATNQTALWEGTGGIAPEGPHIYLRDGWYYLLIAEGGTGLNHMVTMARSRTITGPFEACPQNPVLTNTNTTAYFQTIGHADLFQDSNDDWWAVALSTRSGPEFVSYPMGRETVLTNVSWPSGVDWPVFQQVSANIDGPSLPLGDFDGDGEIVDADDDITFSNSTMTSLPPHFVHWRIPDPEAYIISPADHPNSLQIMPSKLNLTGLDGNGADSPQTFVGRRQVHSLFEFGVDFEGFRPESPGDEAGIAVFSTQNHHIDFSILCPLNSTLCEDSTVLRIHTETTPNNKTDTIIPTLLYNVEENRVRMAVKGINQTHYEFLYGMDAGELQSAGYALTRDISWGFDGAMLGVFATTNGGNVTKPVYVGNWAYTGIAQIIS